MAILIFWWMLFAWAAAIISFLLLRYLLVTRFKQKQTLSNLPIAHSMHLTQLPEYVAALKQYRLLAGITAGLLSLCLLGAIILTARPAAISNINPVQNNRDIMLCLDASGSVLREDTALINRFSTLVKDFNDQRFGLTLFNSSAVSIIPLNNNYQLINQQLKRAGQAFTLQKGAVFTELTEATLAGYKSGTSLVGDGLTSCIQHMGSNPQRRSQSIVLATDNEVNGKPIIAVTQALESAAQRNIHMFILDPGISENKLAGDHEQLKLIAKQTNGGYYSLKDSNAVDDLIAAITKQTPEQFVGVPQLAVNDNPRLLLLIVTTLIGLSLGLLWRLEL